VAAVGLLKGGDDIAEFLLTAAEVGAGIEGRVEVGGREVELLKGEFGDRGGRAAERIEVRLKVAKGAVGVDEVVDAGLLETVDDRGGGRGDRPGTGQSGGEGAVGIAEGEALEEGAPSRINRIGMIEPSLIHLFDNGRVGVGRDSRGTHEKIKRKDEKYGRKILRCGRGTA